MEMIVTVHLCFRRLFYGSPFVFHVKTSGVTLMLRINSHKHRWFSISWNFLEFLLMSKITAYITEKINPYQKTHIVSLSLSCDRKNSSSSNAKWKWINAGEWNLSFFVSSTYLKYSTHPCFFTTLKFEKILLWETAFPC